MRIADGKSIDIVAPAGGLKKDVPVKHGALIVVPKMTVPEGAVVSAHWYGLFSGPIKDGDTPAFGGEPAYFKGGKFTKTKPTAESDVKAPVGVFIDGAVLLTGVTLES